MLNNLAAKILKSALKATFDLLLRKAIAKFFSLRKKLNRKKHSYL